MTTESPLEGVTPAVQRGLNYLYPRPMGGPHEQWEVNNVREVLRVALAEDREAMAEQMHAEECPYAYVCQCDKSWYRAHVDTMIRTILRDS
jgi:hypothetical protein